MFNLVHVNIIKFPFCESPVEDISSLDFSFYDKDGFELNDAEQAYYSAQSFPIDQKILNHTCWQEQWFKPTQDSMDSGLILDHCMILHRSSYVGEARKQLLHYSKQDVRATLVLQTKAKWGFDFALDALSDTGEIFEVLHVEIDHRDYDMFVNHMLAFERIIKTYDWKSIAQSVWAKRSEWQHMQGFHQNNWKSHFVLGDKVAEHTLKSY